MSTHTLLFDIHPEDCTDLLGCSAIGRIAVTVDGHPEIFPVSHVYDRESGCVMFPTNVGSKLRAALGESEVAFEVDGVSPDGDRGWSVLVVGKAEVVSDPDTIARAGRERTVMWRTGNRVHWVRIVPSKVTGRRICASDRGITVRID